MGGKTKTKCERAPLDAAKLSVLKSELHYFKGLSIMLTVLILCVFIAFGALFSAMYLETRAMRLVFQSALHDALPESLQLPAADVPAAVEEPAEESCCGLPAMLRNAMQAGEAAEIDFSQWLSFAKYGVKVSFPETWTFQDRPETKQIHLFADGAVRPDDSTDVGDAVISFIKDDIYAKNNAATTVTVSGVPAVRYAVDNSDILIVPLDKQFLRLKMDTKVDAAVREGIVQYLELIK